MSFYVDIFLRQNLNIMFTISTKCDINKKFQTILTRRGIEKGNGKNEEIKEAMEDLERLSKIKKLRRIAQLKEKAIRNEENGLRHAKEEIEKIEKQNRIQISIER